MNKAYLCNSFDYIELSCKIIECFEDSGVDRGTN